MRTLTFAIVVISCVILFSCDFNDDINPFATDTKTPIFFLLFAVNENQKVDIQFCTNSMSVIPAVIINGDTLKTSIDFYDGIIRGELHNLKFNKTYKYSIAIDSKKTSGEITMPTCPNNVKCNDTLLVDKQLNFLYKADSIRFDWSCDSFDHFCCNLECNSNIATITKDTSIAFATDGSNHYKLKLVSIKGPCLSPGTRPNVTGDCGNGFVMGVSKEAEYNIWFNGASLMKSNDQNSSQIKDKIKLKLLEIVKRKKSGLFSSPKSDKNLTGFTG
jgi:hypothetical protein